MHSALPSNAHATISDVITRFYEHISFPPGGTPRWSELAMLFHSGAVIIPPVSDTNGVSTTLSFDEFVALFSSQFDSLRSTGFTEREVFESTSVFQTIAHRYSAYSITSADRHIPFRGVNMFQLVQHDSAWKITNLIWDRHIAGGPNP